jgi:carboxymethylenebutenolidase
MRQDIIDLYDEYTHKPLKRRVFLERLTQLAGGSAAVAALLPLLEGGGAEAAMIAEDDKRLETGRVGYPGAMGEMRAYMARPKSDEPLPAVMVIHENRGLNPHIEDVTRRLALEGFLALAPDALSPLGGTPADSDEAREMIGSLNRAQAIANYVVAVSYLKDHPGTTGKVGCVGFCWGGAMSNQMAVSAEDLSAAVVYYGSAPASEDVPKIQVPLLLHFAGLDKRVNEGMAQYEADLKAAEVNYRLHVYPDANHAFNNDTSARYHKLAALQAWRRTVGFLRVALAGQA